MTTFLFANNATTNLASNLSSTATTMAVTTGTGALFPNPSAGQQFAVTLISAANNANQEIVYVTAVSGDTFTIVRGQENTTAQAFVVGDIAANFWTAGQAAAMQQSGSAITAAQLQAQAGNWAADSGTANAMAVTLNPVPANLAALQGMPIRILKGTNANTGAVTLNVNSFGAKAVQLGGSALVASQLPASCFLTVIWDGTNTFDLQSVTPIANFTGDGGSGGKAGLVPAPSAGSAAANAFLSADGGFQTVYKSWGTFLGQGTNGSCTVSKGYNIASVTRSAAGTYVVAFTTPMTDSHYGVFLGFMGQASSGGYLNAVIQVLDGSKTVNGFTIWSQQGASAGGSGGVDNAEFYIQVLD